VFEDTKLLKRRTPGLWHKECFYKKTCRYSDVPPSGEEAHGERFSVGLFFICGGIMNRIRVAEQSDWDGFIALAEAEGWRVPQREQKLFRGPWKHAARALVVAGRCCGLVTAVAHQRSGWIGNLLVPPAERGRGYGRELFEGALAVLHAQETTSVWLTASAAGRPLYERYGFVAVDQVERWVLAACRFGTTVAGRPGDPVVLLQRADRAAWGENRSGLIACLADQAQVFACEDAVALLQHGPDLQIIGPWYTPSGCLDANRQVLHNLLGATDPAVEIVIDVLGSAPIRPLLAAAGFTFAGRNDLMVRGAAGHVRLAMMAALASLGSFG
jgi:GNAT superfamily N-acetyltransferase